VACLEDRRGCVGVRVGRPLVRRARGSQFTEGALAQPGLAQNCAAGVRQIMPSYGVDVWVKYAVKRVRLACKQTEMPLEATAALLNS